MYIHQIVNPSECYNKTNKNIKRKTVKNDSVIKFLLRQNFNFEKHFDIMKTIEKSIFPNKQTLLLKYQKFIRK